MLEQSSILRRLGPLWLLALMSGAAPAVDLDWRGLRWHGFDHSIWLTDFGGSQALAVEVSDISGGYYIGNAEHQTSDAFRGAADQAVVVQVYDEGVGFSAPQLQVYDSSWNPANPGSNGAWIILGAWDEPGVGNYRVYWEDYEGFGDVRYLDTGVPRTAGLHTFGIALAADGSVSLSIDGQTLGIDTSALSPGMFEYVYLAVNGYFDNPGAAALFTDVSLNGGLDPPGDDPGLPDVVQLSIDVLPCSRHNIVNLNWYAVPVAILGETSIDVKKIDLRSVIFAGARPWFACLRDIDRDRDKDLVIFFLTSNLTLTPADTEATLTCLYDGLEAEGTDEVRVVPRRRRR